MNIAYIVLAHKNMPQVKKLLETIEDENVYIFLHLDKLAGKRIFDEARSILGNIKNLTFITRYPANWGSFGLVKATLEGIRLIVTQNKYDYVIILSGQDYPIKPLGDLYSFLKKNEPYSFMEFSQFPISKWDERGGYDRIEKWYVTLPLQNKKAIKDLRGKINQFLNILFPNRKFPEGFVPFGGSQWWCLHIDCINYINNFIGTHTGFLRFFSSVRIPDEIFFQTVLMNSPLRDKIQNRSLTFVNWDGPPFPKLISEDDIDDFTGLEYFFARKFDSSSNPEILNLIDDRLLRSGSPQ